MKGLPSPHPIAHVSSQRARCKGGPGRGAQVPGGACRGVASAAPADPRLPSPPRVGGWNAALRRLQLLQAPHPRRAAAAEGAAGSSGSPGAWPNHRYVMRRFLLWRHFCGIGCPACSPGASCLPPPPGRALLSPWVSGPDPVLSVSLSLSLSPVSATSTGEQHFCGSPYQESSPGPGRGS